MNSFTQTATPIDVTSPPQPQCHKSLIQCIRQPTRNLITSIMATNQSSVFDCVSHSILLRKLHRYKCHDDTIQWFKNYLTSRSQYVSVGRVNSRIVTLERGVPQGSILGPLLFLIYTNEMAETVLDTT